MATYVFITSKFLPAPSANGVCVYNISKELIKTGHKVVVICEGHNSEHRIYDGIETYEVKPTLFKYWRVRAAETKKKSDLFMVGLIRIFRSFVKALTFFSFPDVSPRRSIRVYKLLEKINKDNTVDYIVGTFRPYESIKAVHKFKKEHPQVKSILIYWDLLRGKNPFGQSFYKLFDFLCYKSEKTSFSLNDKILIPQSGKSTYDNDRFLFAKDKIYYFDFPVFTDAGITPSQVQNKSDEINLMCIGTIDGENRSAAYFLYLADLINNVSDTKFRIHFVGTFSDVRTYEKYKSSDYVTFYGSVDYVEIPSFIHKADFLVNIGNKITYDMIPSKIFQYFASGKPILNFVAHEEDKSLEYFNRYKLKCNIFEYKNDTDEDIIRLRDYIFNTELKLLNYSEIEVLYRSSKPKFFTEEFLK